MGIGRPTLAVGASSRELYGDVLVRIQQKLQEDEPTFSELAQIAAGTGGYGGVGDAPKDGELVVTIVRTNELPPSR
jgi:hypothetical protein